DFEELRAAIQTETGLRLKVDAHYDWVILCNRFGWGALWPGLVVLGALVVVVALLVIRRSRGIPKNASGAPDDVVERGTGPTPLLASKGETPEPMPPEPPEDDPLEDAL
ncbi:MAG: hypothetical protein M1143_01675, partial [Candidatus Thermoplasmatota archaeon]|nr:hypothetical protein [Candidatus Thermoplasmatota archaeon]